MQPSRNLNRWRRKYSLDGHACAGSNEHGNTTDTDRATPLGSTRGRDRIRCVGAVTESVSGRLAGGAVYAGGGKDQSGRCADLALLASPGGTVSDGFMSHSWGNGDFRGRSAVTGRLC